MKVFRHPEKETWSEIVARPVFDTFAEHDAVRTILADVKDEGDAAVRRYTELHDGVRIGELRVGENEFCQAEKRIPEALKTAIKTAKANIEKFHLSQCEEPKRIETTPGVCCWRKSVAIEKVGLYIPAGSAPLFSTVLMLAVPAKLAGCSEIVLCSPPDKKGSVADVILYTAKLCGVTDVFRVGGAQAIGALAYGTETISKVYKIFGPGNRFVTAAKQAVSVGDVAIDMPAGPSEVAVFADETSEPAFVAADLLSQAEHGPDSQVLLVSTREDVIGKTLAEVEGQIEKLPRRDIARKALEHSLAILVNDEHEAVDLLNEYAPEHLVLAVENAETIGEQITNAGSIFLGHYSCESAGDYASGTNHTLPTAGFARAFSGVSLDSFVKKITFQQLTADGLNNLGPAIEVMAEAEGLHAHKNAVSVRLRKINGI
jgi:histidinol dehydrogenase